MELAFAEKALRDLTLNSLTTAGLCKYDMDPARSNAQFKLAFTPDQSNPSTYVLGGSNPGQIAYNVLYQGGTGPTAPRRCPH